MPERSRLSLLRCFVHSRGISCEHTTRIDYDNTVRHLQYLLIMTTILDISTIHRYACFPSDDSHLHHTSCTLLHFRMYQCILLFVCLFLLSIHNDSGFIILSESVIGYNSVSTVVGGFPHEIHQIALRCVDVPGSRAVPCPLHHVRQPRKGQAASPYISV